MKMSFSPPLCFLIVLLFLSLSLFSVSCRGQEQENGSSGAPMERGEQEALYSAIQGFVGKLWNGSDLYPDPCGWTPIQGVYCDLYNGSWYVSTLNIGPVFENSLKCAQDAEFTHHLFKLKHLTTLSVYSCFFLSPHQNPVRIPSFSWGTLSNTLESLEFRSNPGLAGTIPASIGSLKQLQSLVLLENGLTGSLPTELGNLISLKRLVLSSNGFAGQIPPALGGLNNLLILDCSRNNLSGPLPLTFGGLTSLLKLDLSNNNLDGSLPRQLGKMRNLTLLDLGGNKISGGLIQDIQEMVSLKEMVMSNNPTLRGDLTGIEWANLEDLEVLDLSNTGLRGHIPEAMTQLKRLRFLGLGDNSLSGTPPPKLASLPCIGALYLKGNNLTGQLDFPGTFYGKMGRRFGAWNNPGLCHLLPLTSSSSAAHVPLGVRPCSREGNANSNHVGSSVSIAKMSEGYDDLHWDSQIGVSVGCPSWGGNGLWWALRGKEMMTLVCVASIVMYV